MSIQLVLCGLATVLGARLSALRPAPVVRAPQLRCTAEASALDIVGDGGVLKTVQQEGSGALPARGATVEVHYEGFLMDTGQRFDSSRERGKTFKFTLGEGKVIGGWEVGLAAMKVGERSTLVCSPQYAYGQRGIPPMIPPSATLKFDVELLSMQNAQAQPSSFADDNPDLPRTPGDIAAAYGRKMAEKAKPKEGIEGFVAWAKSIYVFGFFSDEKGERPPWYLNPLVTFPAIFAVVGAGFWLTVALDGVHRGELPTSDDLSGLID